MGNEVSHYGVKGMHWGVRKGRTSAGGTPSRKVKKADAKFEKNASSTHTLIEVHNRAAAYTNEHSIDRINNKPQYKNVDFSKDSPLRRKYYNEHAKAFNDALKIAANSLGSNASGTRRYTVTVDNASGVFSVHTEEIKHAPGDAPFKVIPKFDAKGYIISFAIEEAKTIAHYGVKGMHWGERKARRAEANKPNAEYSQRKRVSDQIAFGKDAEKRINRRMNAGKTHKQAVRREYVHALSGAAITSGIASTLVILDLYGKHPVTLIAKRAETKRGQAAAAAAMGLPRKPTNGPTYSKKSRRGVHKITSL